VEWIRWRHELTNGAEDDPELGIILLLRVIEAAGLIPWLGWSG
jgi:hypothetical protein